MNDEKAVQIERELRDDALSTIDVMEQKLRLAQSEIGRLSAELALAKQQVSGFYEKLKKLSSKRAITEETIREEADNRRKLWNFAMQEIYEMLPPTAMAHPGWTVAEILERLPESVRIEANREADLVDLPTLSKRIAERALRGRYFERTADDRYRRLPGWEAAQADQAA